MPFFSQAPSSSLSASLKRAIGGSEGQLDPMQEIEIDAKAASTAQSLAMVDKLRAEVKAKQEEQQMRTDPARAAEYAGNVAGMDRPNSLRLAANLRGDTEQPSVADVEDAAIIGREAAPFRVTAPDVTPGQRNAFQRSLAAIGANLLATGHTNADQLIQGQGRLQEQDITQRVQDAIAGGKVQDASAMNQGGKLGTAIKLFDNVGDTGATYSPSTGAVQADPTAQPGNSLLKGTLDKIKAAIGKDNAAAGASGAHAGLYNAQADKVRNPPAKGPDAASFKDVTTLRKEFNDQKEVVAFRDVIPIIESARATPDSRAGDIQIAYAVGKILDPASVVREGELKLVGNAATIPEKLQGEMRALLMGKGRLTPETRKSLMQMLDVAVDQRQTAYQAAEDTYRSIARQNGFPEDQVIINAPRRKPAQAGEETKVVNGKTYVKSGGKWFEK